MRVLRVVGLTSIFFVLLVTLVGCAARGIKNPNLSSATLWELNTAHQLSVLERDYRTFFIDVGDAKRAGILSDQQVAALNDIGHRLKPAIEETNKVFKAWQVTRDEPTKRQVIELLLQAQRIWLELSIRRTNMLNEGGSQ